MRAGEPCDRPVFLGSASQAEASKFAELADRRFPIMVLPNGTKVTVWLIGYASGVHEHLASIFPQKIAMFSFNHRSIGIHERVHLQEVLPRTVGHDGSPRVIVDVTEAGQIDSRHFTRGTGEKEADVMFTTGPSIPRQQAKYTCAVEVASTNEGIEGLVFEGMLWGQNWALDQHRPHASHKHDDERGSFWFVKLGNWCSCNAICISDNSAKVMGLIRECTY